MLATPGSQVPQSCRQVDGVGAGDGREDRAERWWGGSSTPSRGRLSPPGLTLAQLRGGVDGLLQFSPVQHYHDGFVGIGHISGTRSI